MNSRLTRSVWAGLYPSDGLLISTCTRKQGVVVGRENWNNEGKRRDGTHPVSGDEGSELSFHLFRTDVSDARELVDGDGRVVVEAQQHHALHCRH